MPTEQPTFTNEELQREEWRSVVGYESYYRVSSLGRIKSLLPSNRRKGEYLRYASSKRGYYKLVLYRPKQSFEVQILIARAFIGPCPEGHTVNHEDGVKTNNRDSNLKYTTPQGQMDHAIRMGLTPKGDRSARRKHPELYAKGADHVGAKFTWEEVAMIRASGRTQSELARSFNVSGGTIGRVKRGERYKNAPSL